MINLSNSAARPRKIIRYCGINWNVLSSFSLYRCKDASTRVAQGLVPLHSCLPYTRVITVAIVKKALLCVKYYGATLPSTARAMRLSSVLADCALWIRLTQIGQCLRRFRRWWSQ